MLRTIFIMLVGLLGGTAFAQAQVIAAMSDMQTLGNAEELCASDTGFYVSLETLNDIPGTSTPTTPYDGINNEGGTWVIRPSKGIFESGRVNLLTAFLSWQGPYVNYQAGQTQTALTPYDRGSPLDPWGSPYYFFMPAGLVRGDEGAITLELYADIFDRPTIASLGPDGVKSSDDLFYQFGGGVSTFAVTSVKQTSKNKTAIEKQMLAGTTPSGGTFTVAAGSTILIRGVNFGATQSGAQVKWGSNVLPNTGWSDRQTTVSLPGALAGSAPLTVTRGASTSLPATLVILAIINRARSWELYQ